MEAYQSFIVGKGKTSVHCTTDAAIVPVPASASQHLYPFQLAIVKWALQQRACAVFAGTGLGKSFSLLCYADALVTAHQGKSVIVFTPLCR